MHYYDHDSRAQLCAERAATLADDYRHAQKLSGDEPEPRSRRRFARHALSPARRLRDVFVQRAPA